MRNGTGFAKARAYPSAWPYASFIAMFHAGVPRRAVPSFFALSFEPCFASRMKQPAL